MSFLKQWKIRKKITTCFMSCFKKITIVAYLFLEGEGTNLKKMILVFSCVNRKNYQIGCVFIH